MGRKGKDFSKCVPHLVFFLIQTAVKLVSQAVDVSESLEVPAKNITVEVC